MSEEKQNTMTVSELKAYLYSLEKEKEEEKQKRTKEYLEANEEKEKKQKQNKAIAKIEKDIEKEYSRVMETKEEICEILEEMQEIPKDIEKLMIAEYMIYRVDYRKAEKYVNKIAKQLEKSYISMKRTINQEIEELPRFK